MGRALSGIGDMSNGEQVGCNLFPTPILSGSPNVFVNGKAVATEGSILPPHFCFIGNTLISHTNRSISSGSPTVYVNGKAAAAIGSLVNCGDTIAQGSPTVFVG